MTGLGIYRAMDGTGIFFKYPVQDALKHLLKATLELAPDAALIHPDVETTARRIGQVVVEAVEDEFVYKVQPVDVGKPEVRRKPPGQPGTWAIQSLRFAKDRFTAAQARKWIRDHDDYGDHGVDETPNQLRFRQYDPAWFDQIRIITLTAGVTAAYGRIASMRQKNAAAVEKLFVDAEVQYDAMLAINKMIAQTGIRVVKHTTSVIEKDNGEQEEERFILSVVLEPNNGKDGAPLNPDTQNDIYSAAEIRKGLHNWAISGGQIDLMHNWKPMSRDDVCPVEYYIAPVDFTCGENERAYKVLQGSWMMGLKVFNDDLWEAVKANDIGAYSIGGESERTPVQPNGTTGG